MNRWKLNKGDRRSFVKDMLLADRASILILEPAHNALLMIEVFASEGNCSLAHVKLSATNWATGYRNTYLWSWLMFFFRGRVSNYSLEIPLETLPMESPSSSNCYIRRMVLHKSCYRGWGLR